MGCDLNLIGVYSNATILCVSMLNIYYCHLPVSCVVTFMCLECYITQYGSIVYIGVVQHYNIHKEISVSNF